MMMFVSAGNIVLLVVLALLLILYPVLMVRRNKREQEKQKQLTDSLKTGEYVLTYSGIFGKITEIIEKEVGKFLVIETGEKNKTYVTVSENAIYTVVNNNPKVYTKEDADKALETPKKRKSKTENNVK